MTIVMNGKILNTAPWGPADTKFIQGMSYAIDKWRSEGNPMSGDGR